jgi:hypothetical protein
LVQLVQLLSTVSTNTINTLASSGTGDIWLQIFHQLLMTLILLMDFSSLILSASVHGVLVTAAASTNITNNTIYSLSAGIAIPLLKRH